MKKIYTVLGVCVLAAVFAGFYELRLSSTTLGTVPPEEPDPQEKLTQEFHDKNLSPVDYAAQMNARDMADVPSYPHELTVEVLRIRAAAERGDPLAQGRLGEMYHNGEGMERDLRKAFYWFRLGAEKGDRNALIHLGRYYKGEFPELGIAPDLDRAEELLRPLADAGDIEAMTLLGTVLQEKVLAGEKDRGQEATWWYNRGTGGEWDADYTPPALPGKPQGGDVAANVPDGAGESAGDTTQPVNDGENDDSMRQYP